MKAELKTKTNKTPDQQILAHGQFQSTNTNRQKQHAT